jgi:hypothetical protein
VIFQTLARQPRTLTSVWHQDVVSHVQVIPVNLNRIKRNLKLEKTAEIAMISAVWHLLFHMEHIV